VPEFGSTRLTAHDNYNSKKEPTPEMVAAIQVLRSINMSGTAALALLKLQHD